MPTAQQATEGVQEPSSSTLCHGWLTPADQGGLKGQGFHCRLPWPLADTQSIHEAARTCLRGEPTYRGFAAPVWGLLV